MCGVHCVVEILRSWLGFTLPIRLDGLFLLALLVLFMFARDVRVFYELSVRG